MDAVALTGDPATRVREVPLSAICWLMLSAVALPETASAAPVARAATAAARVPHVLFGPSMMISLFPLGCAHPCART
jgi:hypothetical protein